MKAKIEPQVDELYKLPLDEFTKARNTLAKTLSGTDKKGVAALVKPSVAMWVVNQLYWQDASTTARWSTHPRNCEPRTAPR